MNLTRRHLRALEPLLTSLEERCPHFRDADGRVRKGLDVPLVETYEAQREALRIILAAPPVSARSVRALVRAELKRAGVSVEVAA